MLDRRGRRNLIVLGRSWRDTEFIPFGLTYTALILHGRLSAAARMLIHGIVGHGSSSSVARVRGAFGLKMSLARAYDFLGGLVPIYRYGGPSVVQPCYYVLFLRIWQMLREAYAMFHLDLFFY